MPSLGPPGERIEQLSFVRRLEDERRDDDDEVPIGDDEVMHDAERAGVDAIAPSPPCRSARCGRAGVHVHGDEAVAEGPERPVRLDLSGAR